MALNWIRDVTIQLRDGHSVRDHNNQDVDVVRRGWVAFDGGFAHIVVPGLEEIQVVSASAVWRASYPARLRRVRRLRDPRRDPRREP